MFSMRLLKVRLLKVRLLNISGVDYNIAEENLLKWTGIELK